MTIYSRSNLPERIAKEAVRLVMNKSNNVYQPLDMVEIIDVSNQIYSVTMSGYPKIRIEIQDRNAMVSLLEENSWYQNMQTGEESNIYFI